MHVQQIRTIARTLGVRPGKLDRVRLIRAIQLAEGNFDCVATAYDGVCDQMNCAWRRHCFALAAGSRRVPTNPERPRRRRLTRRQPGSR